MFRSHEASDGHPNSGGAKKPQDSPDWRYPFAPRPGLKTEVMRGGGYRIIEQPKTSFKRKVLRFLRGPSRH